MYVFSVAHERETRPRTRTRRPHCITTPTTTRMGWRSDTLDSVAHWWVPARTHGTPVPDREGRGWPEVTSTRRQTTTSQRQTLSQMCFQETGVQVKNPHQRSPYAVKFEDRSHEETGRQERCARSKAWNLAKNIYKLKENDQATFHSPAEEWVLPAASTKEPEEREFVVDSGASVHVVSKRDLDSAELETMRTSKKSDDGDDGQRRGANKRRSHGLCQRIGFIRDSDAS